MGILEKNSVFKRLLKRGTVKRNSVLYIGAATITAISIISVMQNSILPYNRTNNVYAMEQSFQDFDITGESLSDKPQVEVKFDMNVEENEQKSVDAGHSPWRLDPAFVAQVFVSLKISPEGIQGDYPVEHDEIKITQNTGNDLIAEVNSNKTAIGKVYLKRLIRQDSTGIWTVVGYDNR